jgi:putative ABC transport system permease protein
MKVSNRKCVRHLAWKSLLASRTRNLIAIVAIALTTMLFTSLFTIALSINDGFQQSNFRQVGGFSHGGFKYMTQAQFDELKDDPLIGQWGERRYLGMPREAPFNKAHVEVSFADANEAHWMYCDPVEGSEAYIHTLVADGKAEPIRTPSDHSQVALIMRALTDEKSMR